MNTIQPALHQLLVKQRQKTARRQVFDFQPPQFARPLIIVSAPRVGVLSPIVRCPVGRVACDLFF